MGRYSTYLVNFYCWTWHKDADLLFNFLSELRKYHHERIFIFSDNSLTLVQIEKLKSINNSEFVEIDGKKWLTEGVDFLDTRYSYLLNNSEANYFIKVEADDDIWRTISFESIFKSTSKFVWLGQVYRSKAFSGTWGGGMVLGRSTIEHFLSKRKDPETFFTYRSVFGEVLFSEDETLAYYLQLEPQAWTEVNLQRNFNREFLSKNWALTHASLSKPIQENYFKVVYAPKNTLDSFIFKKSFRNYVFYYENIEEVYSQREYCKAPEYCLVFTNQHNFELTNGTILLENYQNNIEDLENIWFEYQTSQQRYKVCQN